MNQWGPEWQRLQRQEMRLVSDLIREKEWAQELDTLAIGWRGSKVTEVGRGM